MKKKLTIRMYENTYLLTTRDSKLNIKEEIINEDNFNENDGDLRIRFLLKKNVNTDIAKVYDLKNFSFTDNDYDFIKYLKLNLDYKIDCNDSVYTVKIPKKREIRYVIDIETLKVTKEEIEVIDYLKSNELLKKIELYTEKFNSNNY